MIMLKLNRTSGACFWETFNNLRLTFLFVKEKEGTLLNFKHRTTIISPQLISWFPMEQIMSFPCLAFPLLCFVCPVQTLSCPMQGNSGPAVSCTCSPGHGFYITITQTLIIFAFHISNSKVIQHPKKMNAEFFAHTIKKKIIFNSERTSKKIPPFSVALPTRFLYFLSPIKLQQIYIQNCKQ